MNRLQRWWNGKWAVPVVSGALIIASFIASGLFDAAQVGDIAMLAAAIVAGTPIVIKAVRALMTKVIGIDLLVSVAAIGAVIIDNYWEAAAVTFLFAIGHALEAATLNKTRAALAERGAVAQYGPVVGRAGGPGAGAV